MPVPPGVHAPDQFAHFAATGHSIGYIAPADDLRDCITGYHVYSSIGPNRFDELHWFLPGTANIRFAVRAGPVSVSIGSRTFAVPPASLFGPATRPLRVVTNGGHMVGVGISAIGWSRLAFGAASQFCDRVVPLDGVTQPGIAAMLLGAVAATDLTRDLAAVLDSLFRGLLGPPGADDAVIRRLMKLSVANRHTDVAVAAAELGVSEHTLRRVARRYFGMMPKLLLTRARFLRSYLAAIAGDSVDYDRIDPSYTDVPHFLRDANRFLGMTPRRFFALDTPFLNASLRIHAAVLGAETQVLNAID